MAGTHTSHERLMATLAGLTDGQVTEPSHLPGWTRGHLLTHVARNADSHVRLLSAAARGEQVEQYVRGIEGRAADIEAGAARSARELVADVASSASELFDLWPRLPETVWDRELVAIHGGQRAWVCVFSRWRETEIHHADLDLGFHWADWSRDFIAATLPHVAATLERRLNGRRIELSATDSDYSEGAGDPNEPPTGVVRGSGAEILAWLSGRSRGEGLEVEGSSLPTLGAWS
jgi:maleylpyruvate isomerase